MNADLADPTLRLADLLALAVPGPNAPCSACAPLVCRGWQSVGAADPLGGLQRRGTLREPDVPEPTLAEWHPQGTHYWSDSAPIALRWFPYNRCDLLQCRGCGRAFLHYTEYGGYYLDQRLRALDPALLTDA